MFSMNLPSQVTRRIRFNRRGAELRAFNAPANAPSGGASGLELGPGFAGAALAKKKYDLMVAQALANQGLQLGELGQNYVLANRGLEANLEARGIMKSGEGMRNRIELGAQEKAARAALEAQTLNAINQYGLDYAYQLAAAQAAGQQPAPAPAPAPSPSPSRPPSGSPSGSPSSVPPTGPSDVPPTGPSGGGNGPVRVPPGPFRPGVPAGVRDPAPIPNPPQPFRPGVPAGVRDPAPIPNPPTRRPPTNRPPTGRLPSGVLR